MLISTKWLFGVAIIACIVSLFPVLSAKAPWQKQGEAVSLLPEGRGKELVASACVQCHTLNIVTSMRESAADWEKTVDEMISRGAQITTDETKLIAGYLAENFGASGQPPPSAGSPTAGAEFPDAPGKEVFVNKCFQCHNDGVWKTLRQDKRGWEITIYPMVGRGALWTGEEISAMAEYLTSIFGPKSAEAPRSQGRQE